MRKQGRFGRHGQGSGGPEKGNVMMKLNDSDRLHRRLARVPAWYFERFFKVRERIEAHIAAGRYAEADEDLDHIEERIEDWATD